jgi:hypothetical protein
MAPTLAFAVPAPASVLAPPATASFWLHHSPETPTYYQLSLEDDQGSFAHWVIPLPLKQLAKRPVVLWRLPAPPALSALPCVESGRLRLAPAQHGTMASLRTELAQGVLRLNFHGQLLRGYFRLHCLPQGGGQLWQLTPIGHV